MKAKLEKKAKIRIVKNDPILDSLKDRVLFPEKLEAANKLVKTLKLPGEG